MANSPTPAEILDAVAASGYLLEQQTANVFEASGYGVDPSYAFEDPDDKVSREIDVRATKELFRKTDQYASTSIWLECFVECKNTAAPLVFLARPKGPRGAQITPRGFIFSCGEKQKQVRTDPPAFQYWSAFRYFGFSAHHYYWSTASKCTQFCRIEGHPGKWKADHGAIYNGHIYPLAKALAVREADIGRGADNYGFAVFLVPIVVTTAPLFVIDTSSTVLSCNPAEHVTLIRHLSAKGLAGYFTVEFVTASAVASFLDSKLQPFLQAVVRFADMHPRALFFPRDDTPGA